MIKFPSIETIASQLMATIKRFPLTVLCTIAGTCILIYLTHTDWESYYSNNKLLFWAKLAMCAELGLCIFLGTSLMAESKGTGMVQRIIINAIGFAFIAVYYFSIRHYERFEVMGLTRYTLYLIASHLFVAFAPFTAKGSINGFWQFNRALFIRFLLSFLYTVVLYAGVSIAMLLLDQLLHVNIHSRYYAYAWFIMVGLFNTVFFLAGIPKDIPALDSDNTYLKGLKAFTQFVLLPLVTCYLFILYAYMVRILIMGSLPKGYVSYLVISFSGMGILSLLLIYPIRHHEDNKWVSTFAKWFYRALYPLIILLGFSIYHRVHEYGITPDRYFIVLLALWLACIAAYFLFSKRENIKVIPVSLCLIAVLSSFGPWGVFSVSANSQMRQLEELLTEHKGLKDGKLNQNVIANLPDSVSRRALSIVSYLVTADELGRIQPWVKQNLDSLQDSNSYSRYGYMSYEESETVMHYMGFSGYSTYSRSNDESDYYKHSHISFYIEYSGGSSEENMQVSGYDYISKFEQYTRNQDAEADTVNYDVKFYAGKDTFSLVPYRTADRYGIMMHGKVIANINLQDTITAWRKRYVKDSGATSAYLPPDICNLPITGNGYSFKFRITQLTVRTDADKPRITAFNADVLTKYNE